MRSSYYNKDVMLLLKDITGLVQPLSTQEREKRIQSGVHYCEMLPLEYKPSEKYLEIYKKALKHNSKQTALAVGNVAEKIYEQKGKELVLVSLARAGTPIGILIKRYLEKKYPILITHYTISIIRGKGIDKNAIHYILERHLAKDIQFVDGWIGKGAILQVLEEELKQFEGISSKLAVVADPANCTELFGTQQDILIPNSCLNSTVCGLISRTFLRNDIILEHDFHGAVYYKELESEDVSYHFIDSIEQQFDFTKRVKETPSLNRTGIEEVKEIADYYQISDINFIKPGIGETTRVLLRRVPWKILINENYKEDSVLLHIFQLAKEKQVEILYYPLKNYKTCGIIKQYGDT